MRPAIFQDDGNRDVLCGSGRDCVVILNSCLWNALRTETEAENGTKFREIINYCSQAVPREPHSENAAATAYKSEEISRFVPSIRRSARNCEVSVKHVPFR